MILCERHHVNDQPSFFSPHAHSAQTRLAVFPIIRNEITFFCLPESCTVKSDLYAEALEDMLASNSFLSNTDKKKVLMGVEYFKTELKP